MEGMQAFNTKACIDGFKHIYSVSTQHWCRPLHWTHEGIYVFQLGCGHMEGADLHLCITSIFLVLHVFRFHIWRGLYSKNLAEVYRFVLFELNSPGSVRALPQKHKSGHPLYLAILSKLPLCSLIGLEIMLCTHKFFLYKNVMENVNSCCLFFWDQMSTDFIRVSTHTYS